MKQILFAYSLNWDGLSLRFRILEQAYERRDMHPPFISSNGWQIRQSVYPDFTVHNRLIWIRGSDIYYDPIECTNEFDDGETAADVAAQMQQALREWANHGAFTQGAIGNGICTPENVEPLLPVSYGVTTLYNDGLAW